MLEKSSKEERLKLLKKYDQQENCSCLKCGYTGLMGIVGISKKISLIMILYFVVGFLMTYYCYINRWYIWLLIGWAPLALKIITRPKILQCPECGTIVEVKKLSNIFLVGKF